MPRNFVRKNFDHWMRNNRHRFKHPPYVTKKWKNGFSFQFAGAAPQLIGHISKFGFFTINVIYKRMHWDIIMEFDVFSCRNSKGQYYCSECVDAYERGLYNKQPLLYSSKQELWSDHCFEPLLKWTKEKLQSSNRLHLISGEGYTHVLIKKRGDIKKSDCTYILPVV